MTTLYYWGVVGNRKSSITNNLQKLNYLKICCCFCNITHRINQIVKNLIKSVQVSYLLTILMLTWWKPRTLRNKSVEPLKPRDESVLNWKNYYEHSSEGVTALVVHIEMASLRGRGEGWNWQPPSPSLLGNLTLDSSCFAFLSYRLFIWQYRF